MDISTNGHEQPALEKDQASPSSGFTEEERSVTLESGATLCRFNPLKGGRLERWQWRYTPPPQAIEPGSARGAHPPLELVDPEGGALIDRFLALGTKPEEIAAGTEREFGDFVDGEYRSQAVDTGGEVRIGLLRDGAIRAGTREAAVRMAKSAAVRPGAADIAVLYRVINSSLRPLQILFAAEFNLYAPGITSRGDAWQEGYYLVDGARPEDPTLGSSGVSPNATHVAIANPVGEMALQLGWDREADLWRMPAAGESAAVRLLVVWRIQLPPRDNWAMGLWLAPS